MISAGSPGSNCCSEKMSTDTKNKVGISCSRRLPRRFNMADAVSPTGQPYSLERKPHHADKAVRHLRVAVKFCRVRDENTTVIEVDLGNIRENGLRQFFVNRLARGDFRRDARLVEQFVDIGVAIAHRVLRRVALEEDVRIAVGISAPAPCQQVGLIVALLGLLERGGKFRNTDLQVDPDFARHGLDDFGTAWVSAPFGTMKSISNGA